MRIKNFKGFSLIELMIVVTIIGILAVVATISSTDTIYMAKVTKTREDLEKLHHTIKEYAVANGSFPQSLSLLEGRHLSKIPVNPWGERYSLDNYFVKTKIPNKEGMKPNTVMRKMFRNPGKIYFHGKIPNSSFEGIVSIYAMEVHSSVIQAEHIQRLDRTGVVKGGGYKNPALSPDGRLLAFDNGNQIYIFHIDSGELEKDIGITGVEPSWNPTGDKLIYTDKGSGMGISLYNFHTNEIEEGYIPEGSQPNWSPDGRKISYKTNEGIAVVDSSGDMDSKQIIVQSANVSNAKFSNDSTLICFNDSRDCFFARVSGFNQNWQQDNRICEGNSPCFSPNNDLICLIQKVAGADTICVAKVFDNENHIAKPIIRSETSNATPIWTAN